MRMCAKQAIQTDCENRVKQTRVLPYAAGTQSVTCACGPNSDRKIIHRKKISAPDNVLNCQERQLSNVYFVRAGSARPHEFQSDRQPSRLEMTAAPPNVVVRERSKVFAVNKLEEMPSLNRDVRGNFNQVAEIKPVVTQRYCG